LRSERILDRLEPTRLIVGIPYIEVHGSARTNCGVRPRGSLVADYRGVHPMKARRF